MVLMVFPFSNVFACVKSYDKLNTEKISGSKENKQHVKKSCCNEHQKEKDSCHGNCNMASCHCPITLIIPFSSESYQLSNPTNLHLFHNLWTYVQHHPKAVYLTIWQPPKIS